MATQTQTPPRVIQIVGGSKEDRALKRIQLERLIDTRCDRKKAHYIVVSIIGAQGSGKSTLMNEMFGTNFVKLNELAEGRKATTKGIWAGICNDPRAIVLDIEGSDGQEHQDDAGFESQSALFALVISDVIFFNINVQDIGRMHGGSIPLLRIIFQERLNHKMCMTKLVIAVRDYDKEKMNADKLREQLLSTLDKVWQESFKNGETETMKKSFTLSVELFPHFNYKQHAFRVKCQDIIAHSEILYQGQNTWPVDEFKDSAETLWKKIQKNERLDMPSYWIMVSRHHCEAIMSKKLSSLESNKGYQSLTNGDLNDPCVFDAKLQTILNIILSQYEDEAKYYDEQVANNVKQTLKTDILHTAEPNFRNVMEKFKTALCEEATKEIQRSCVETLKTQRHAKYVVSVYSKKFSTVIKGLQLYDVQNDQNFEIKLKWIGESLAKEATKKHATDIAIAATTGVVLGLGGAAAGTFLAGGHIILGAAAVAYGALAGPLKYVTRKASDDAYKRSARKIFEEGTYDTDQNEEGTDDTDQNDSGASSSTSK